MWTPRCAHPSASFRSRAASRIFTGKVVRSSIIWSPKRALLVSNRPKSFHKTGNACNNGSSARCPRCMTQVAPEALASCVRDVCSKSAVSPNQLAPVNQQQSFFALCYQTHRARDMDGSLHNRIHAVSSLPAKPIRARHQILRHSDRQQRPPDRYRQLRIPMVSLQDVVPAVQIRCTSAPLMKEGWASCFARECETASTPKFNLILGELF